MKSCHPDYRQYLVSLYSGMLSGLVFMACIASCLGWTRGVGDLVLVLSICLATALFCQVINEADCR